jgi:hypothetical protein
MSQRLSSFQGCWLPLALVMGGLLTWDSHAADPRPNKSIEFSAPHNEEVSTNAHQLSRQTDGLKQLEEDLFKPLQSFSPKNSFDGVPAMPFTPPVIIRRTPEKPDPRKDWLLMKPEEILGLTPDTHKTEAERDAESLGIRRGSPMEEYARRLAHEHGVLYPGETKEDLYPTKPRRDQGWRKDDPSMPESIRQREQALKKLLQPDAETSSLTGAAPKVDSSDAFGLEASRRLQERTPAQKARMEEYRQLLGFPPTSPVPGANPINPAFSSLLNSSRPATPAPSTLPTGSSSHSTPKRSYDPFTPQFGVLPQMSGGLPSLESKAMNDSGLAPTPLKIQPVQPQVKPPTPDFTAPKRSFL